MIRVPAATYVLALAGADEDAAATGDLDLAADVEIQGAGAASTIVDGAGLDRVFEVRPGVAAGIRDLTIRNGHAAAPFPVRGGGIQNGGTLTLRRCTLTGNLASFGQAAPGGSGGAIHNAVGASLTVEASALIDNQAENTGGGIFNEGALVVRETTLVDNQVFRLLAVGGGGIYHLSGSATISNSTFSGNLVSGLGNAAGGAVRSEAAITLSHCTLTGNDVPASPSSGAGLAFGPVTLANTILDDGCAGVTVTSLGGNLESLGNTCGLSDPSDQTGVSVAALGLGALASNGGATQTHAIAAASAARDAGVVASCAPNDQRGVARPDGDAAGAGDCDAGAFEFTDCDGSGVDDGIEIAAGTLPDADGDLVPDACESLVVEIDVLPGSERNPLRPDRRGVVPVAILGGPGLDVAEIDLSSLAFGPGGAAPRNHSHPEDLDGDGFADLVVRFEMAGAGLAAADLEACLDGALVDGRPFEGCDGVETVGGPE